MPLSIVDAHLFFSALFFCCVRSLSFLNTYGPTSASFCLLSSFSQYNSNLNCKKGSIDTVLGIRTLRHRMVGADGSTEQWRPPSLSLSFFLQKNFCSPWGSNPGLCYGNSSLDCLAIEPPKKVGTADVYLTSLSRFGGSSRGCEHSFVIRNASEKKFLPFIGFLLCRGF